MKPLEKLVVLDLTRVLAGPYASMMLADFGADVIKIEVPNGGDDSREFGPFIGTESVYFMSLNRNKRSMTLNLKNEEGKRIFKELVKQADIVLENFRPGTMEKLGLGYDVLQQINPRLIYGACSGFGHTGPYSQRPAYDVIVQAMGGIMSITGEEGGEPTRTGASIGDITAGLFSTIGLLMALHHRQQTGIGQKVDVAMLDCQVAILENAIARYFTSGNVPQPMGNRHPSITPFESIKAQDGYVIIAVGNDRLWDSFCRLIEKPELIQDERFATNAKRTENQKQLKAILNDVFPAQTVAVWLDSLTAAGIPCGPLNTVDKVVEDPQIKAREMIVEVEHSVAGKVKMAGIPIKMSLSPGAIDRSAPLLGENTEEILQEMLGLSSEEISDLRTQRVL